MNNHQIKLAVRRRHLGVSAATEAGEDVPGGAVIPYSPQ
jgi:hypothetical protein